MTKITEKQLIESLNQLKEIKPRKEWVDLLKSEILMPNAKTEVVAQKIGIWNLIKNLDFGFRISQKLAYSFAVVLFLIVGVFGFARYTVPGDLLFPIKKIAEQSQAALTGQSGVKQDVASLTSRINDLALVAKEGRKDSIPSAISEITANASQLAKNLKDSPAQDPNTLKKIATSLKTLADVPGTDLSANQNVKDLYQAVVHGQIADLERTTLTDPQADILMEIEGLYNQGRYTDALEKILLISK